MGKVLSLLLVVLLVCTHGAMSQSSKLPYYDSTWTKPFEPFRVAGNIYYVGSYELACYLIVTDAGHILINTGLAESTTMLSENMSKLGFKISDIKILLTNQVHYDHVAAMSEIQKMTGAKMMVHANDAAVMEDGGASDYIFGPLGKTFEAVNVDKKLNDKDFVTLGSTRLLVLHHPGHTKGATSFLVETNDEKQKWKVLIANIPTMLSQARISGMPSYPNIGKDYRATLESLREQSFDIWLAAHASQFHLHQKFNADKPYNPEAFADQTGFRELLNELDTEYSKRVKEK